MKERLAFRTRHGVAVFLTETINSSCGINKLLCARKERMALGANFHMAIGLGGPSFDYISASTENVCLDIFRMYTFSHKAGA